MQCNPLHASFSHLVLVGSCQLPDCLGPVSLILLDLLCPETDEGAGQVDLGGQAPRPEDSVLRARPGLRLCAQQPCLVPLQALALGQDGLAWDTELL